MARRIGIITVLVSVGFGSILTYMVQSKTQKRTWKREAALKKIDAIYGPLYTEIHLIVQQLSRENLTEWSHLTMHRWNNIKNRYYYLLADSELRDRLDRLHSDIINFNDKHSKVSSTVEERLRAHLAEILGPGTGVSNCEVTVVAMAGDNTSLEGELWKSIAEGLHPIERRKKMSPEYRSHGFRVYVYNSNSPTSREMTPQELTQFDTIISKTIKEVGSSEVISYVREAAPKLKTQAAAIEQLLKKIIEEPWKLK